MKVGVFTVILQSMSFERALDYLAGLGVQAVEIGAGAFTGTAHCDPEIWHVYAKDTSVQPWNARKKGGARH